VPESPHPPLIKNTYLRTLLSLIMGLASSSHLWYIYGRDKQDYWLPNYIDMSVAQESNELFHIGRFKHQVFLMALALAHGNVHKIYLYHGWRVAKCEKTEKTLSITFTDDKHDALWSTCTRSRLQQLFDAKWKPTENALTFTLR
jgi:hypothetical protein